MKNKLLDFLDTLMLFVLLSICAGPAICLICKFVVLIGPVACAAIVMLTLLGWAVYHEMEDMNRRE